MKFVMKHSLALAIILLAAIPVSLIILAVKLGELDEALPPLLFGIFMPALGYFFLTWVTRKKLGADN